MKHPERSEDYLDHIREMVQRIDVYTKNIDTAEALEKDHLTQDAVMRCITIIGEAATQLEIRDPEFSQKHPNLPWKQMRGMRNRVVHGYFEVQNNVVWDTVKNALPSLGQQVDLVLKQLKQEPARPSFEELKAANKSKDAGRDR